MISTLTDSKGDLLSVSDKVRDEEGFTWWVLSMFPEINSVVVSPLTRTGLIVRHSDQTS